MKFRIPAILGLAWGLILAIDFAGADPQAGDPPAGSYRLVARHGLPGDQRWDYLAMDPATRHLFVSRAEFVQVVDPDSGRVLGTIPGTDGVHGIALAPELGVGFSSNGHSNSVTVFSLDTLKVVDQVAVSGGNPDAIVFDAPSGRVFTFNGKTQNASVIDALTHRQIGSLPLPGRPEFAVSDSLGHVFINIEDKSELVSMDTFGSRIDATWPLGDCDSPSGLALDVAHHRSFSVCGNRKMAILDTVSGRLVASLPIGGHPDAAAYDPHRGLAFSSNGEGTLSVIREDDPDHFSVAGTVTTQESARTMALDAGDGRIYLSAATLQKPTQGTPAPRPALVPGSFTILVIAPP